MDDEKPPHDQLPHRLFSHRVVIEDLLRQVIRRIRGVGGDWVDELDLATLRPEPEISTAAKRLDRRMRDMVWSVAWRGSPLYLILLIEFQSRPDRFMALRQLTYLVLFYEDLIKAKKLAPGNLLPPALPICLYNGEVAWRAPLRFESLVAPCPRELKRFQVRFRHLLIDELKTDVDLGAEERNSAGSVFALQQVDDENHLWSVLDAIQRWLPPAEFETLRRDLLTLMQRVLPERLERATLLEGEEFGMSPKERFTRELERKDAIVRAAGREEGKRDLLLKQLRLKFGELPARVAEKVAVAGLEQVETWAARILTASTLDSVFTAS